MWGGLINRRQGALEFSPIFDYEIWYTSNFFKQRSMILTFHWLATSTDQLAQGMLDSFSTHLFHWMATPANWLTQSPRQLLYSPLPLTGDPSQPIWPSQLDSFPTHLFHWLVALTTNWPNLLDSFSSHLFHWLTIPADWLTHSARQLLFSPLPLTGDPCQPTDPRYLVVSLFTSSTDWRPLLTNWPPVC